LPAPICSSPPTGTRLGSARLGRIAPFIEGFVITAWATATFWFPLMIAIGIWRHLVRRVPLRYHPSYWARVFPLGMYGAATFRMSVAIDLDALRWLPRAELAVALLAWAATLAGLVWSLGGWWQQPRSARSS
jgi:tellurite resistance protein TehA-like permease